MKTTNTEEVVNGDFANGLTGWNNHGTYPYDTFEVVSGELHVVGDGVPVNAIGNSDRDIALVNGVTYTLSYDYDVASGEIEWIGLRYGAGSNMGVQIGVTGSGTKSIDFTMDATGNKEFHFFNDSGTAVDFTIDNISVKQK